MTFSQSAVERLVAGKEALRRGDSVIALKELSVSLSLSPSVEGYYLRAEAHSMASNYDAAVSDLVAAKDLLTDEADMAMWKEKLEQRYDSYLDAASNLQGPPVAEVISVLVPTPFATKEDLIKKLIGCPHFSTDGTTLMRKGKSVVYDIEVLAANRKWLDAVIEMGDGGLKPDIEKRISKTSFFLHITAPNQAIAQSTKSQTDLANQFVQLLELLIYVLGAPVAVLRGSNSVVTHEQAKEVGDNVALPALVGFWVKLLVDDLCVFSVGMHQLGFPDVEFPLRLLPLENALETVIEFMNFQVENGMHEVIGKIEYETMGDGRVYSLERQLEERFNVDGEARYNQFGIWKFLDRVGG